jgi:hypothetical protein
MWVGQIDVHDDEQLRAFWAAGKEGDAYGRPYAAFRSIEATTVALRDKAGFADVVALAATEATRTSPRCSRSWAPSAPSRQWARCAPPEG